MNLLKILLNENIALDLSHLNDECCRGILKIFPGKIQMSHCAVSELLNTPEKRSNSISLKTMEQLVARDALIGICFVNDVVAENANELDEDRIYYDILKQFDFIGHRIGCNNICLGPDFIDLQYYSKVFSKQLIIPKCFFSIAGYTKLFSDLSTIFNQTNVSNIFWTNAHNWYEQIFDRR